MVYCQALLPKAGLGNRLFPWARCKIFSHLTNTPMIFPTWPQIKPGIVLRRERDLRTYHNLFKKDSQEIGGIRKVKILCFAERKKESLDLSSREETSQLKDVVIVFDGHEGYFQRLNGWNEFILRSIRNITRSKWLRRVDKTNSPFIGIHVRRGDFADAKTDKDFIYKGLLKTPISWFTKSLQIIHNIRGKPIRTLVVSDGREGELKDLLKLKSVTFIRTGSAISDLLLLSRAKVLIASGGSSFSAWASFLGQMPTISYPGQSLGWFNLENKNSYYIGEFDPRKPLQSFLEQVKGIFS